MEKSDIMKIATLAEEIMVKGNPVMSHNTAKILGGASIKEIESPFARECRAINEAAEIAQKNTLTEDHFLPMKTRALMEGKNRNIKPLVENSLSDKGMPMGKRYPNAKKDLSPEEIKKLDELYKKRDAAGMRNGTPEYNKIQSEIDRIQGGVKEDKNITGQEISQGDFVNFTDDETNSLCVGRVRHIDPEGISTVNCGGRMYKVPVKELDKISQEEYQKWLDMHWSNREAGKKMESIIGKLLNKAEKLSESKNPKLRKLAYFLNERIVPVAMKTEDAGEEEAQTEVLQNLAAALLTLASKLSDEDEEESDEKEDLTQMATDITPSTEPEKSFGESVESDNIQKIHAELQKNGVDTDEASPNMIAAVAKRLGLQLSSDEVVRASDSYQKKSVNEDEENDNEEENDDDKKDELTPEENLRNIISELEDIAAESDDEIKEKMQEKIASLKSALEVLVGDEDDEEKKIEEANELYSKWKEKDGSEVSVWADKKMGGDNHFAMKTTKDGKKFKTKSFSLPLNTKVGEVVKNQKFEPMQEDEGSNEAQKKKLSEVYYNDPQNEPSTDKEFDELHKSFDLSEIRDEEIKYLADDYLKKGVSSEKLRNFILDRAELRILDSSRERGILNFMEFSKPGFRDKLIALVIRPSRLEDALEKEFGVLEESKLQEQFDIKSVKPISRSNGKLNFKIKYDAKKIASELADRFLKKPYGEYKNTDEDREEYSIAFSDSATDFERKINNNSKSWFRDLFAKDKMHSDLDEIVVAVEVGDEDPADAYYDIEFSLEYAILADDLVKPILSKLNSL